MDVCEYEIDEQEYQFAVFALCNPMFCVYGYFRSKEGIEALKRAKMVS